QRPAVLTCVDLLIGLLGLRQRQIGRLRDDAPQLGVETLNPVEIDTGQSLRRELTLSYPTGEQDYRRKCNVFVALWQRPRVGISPDEMVALRDDLHTWNGGIPARIWCNFRFNGDLMRSDATLIEWRHRLSPVPSGLAPFCIR